VWAAYVDTVGQDSSDDVRHVNVQVHDWIVVGIPRRRSGYRGAVAVGLAILAIVLAAQGGWQGILVAVGLAIVVVGKPLVPGPKVV
jgi:hypothetical protein